MVKRPRGRPSKYTDEAADLICEVISQGKTLKEAAKAADVSEHAVLKWLRKHDDFALQYARAREEQGDAFADQINEWAYMAATGKMEPAAARAASDNLKWLAGKRKPKVYSEKFLVAGDPEGEPIKTEGVNSPEVVRYLASILSQAKTKPDKGGEE